jgi:hypothetical protein
MGMIKTSRLFKIGSFDKTTGRTLKFRFRNDSGELRVLLGIETILVISMEDFVFKTFLFIGLFFPQDFLMTVDESHVISQILPFIYGGANRKENLVECLRLL